MSSLKLINVRKGQILQNKGDLNSKIYKVRKGLLRSYSIDPKGKEHIFMFAPEDWIIADSTLIGLEASLFIDAIEDSLVVVLEKESQDGANLSKIYKRLFILQERIILLMSASAIQRYDHFMETYPKIAQRVPQKMIASYLGITPEALSKVKGERLSKK